MSSLLHAASVGDSTLVQSLLCQKGVSIDHRDHKGNTPLCLACRKGYSEAAKLLLERGSSTELQDNYGNTALCLASLYGHVDLARLLLEKGASIEHQNKNGTTALCWASLNGHVEVARLLLEKGATIDHQNKDGNTALSWASGSGHVEVVGLLLEKGASTEHQNQNGNTPLGVASLNGHVEVARLLLEKGANINHQNKDGVTPLDLARKINHQQILDLLQQQSVKKKMVFNGSIDLLQAAKEGNLKWVQSLLCHKEVYIDHQNEFGNTPLGLASFNGNVEVAKLLLEKGASMEHQNKNGTTPLCWASLNGHVEVARLLLEKGANTEHQTRFGNTPVCSASLNGHVEVVRLLLEKGASMEHQNKNGTTPLCWASLNGHVEVARLLLEKGASTELQNKDGDTALCWASLKGHVEVARLLLEKGASMEHPNKNGETPLDLARKNKHQQIVDLLQQERATVNDLVQQESATDVDLLLQQESTTGVDLLLQKESATDGCDTLSAEGGVGIPILSSPVNQDKNVPVDDEIEASRNALRCVINDPQEDPVPLSPKYIIECTCNFSSTILGQGAFGTVYKGTDLILGSQFAVKRVPFSVPDQATWDLITLSFKKEIATLKRFHHPNIVVLYGYNVAVQQENQFLVYEYLVRGSLSSFLHDDHSRARLSGRIRFSIMYQLVRSVHFLHTGGCGGLTIFHRDIKSGNICLTQNYTAKLIDCGLAKFAPTYGSEGNFMSGTITPSILKSSSNAAFGTPGYMCPRYLRGNYAFEPACDIYSIGVVLAELITGRLQNGQSKDATDGQSSSSYDFYDRYIMDEDSEKVVDGWKVLVTDADQMVDWDLASLERACQLSIKCMATAPKSRITSFELVHELSQIVCMDFASNNSLQQVTESDNNVGKAFKCCALCNRSVFETIQGKKDRRHLCIECIENSILSLSQAGTSGDSQLLKFKTEDLYGKISSNVYNLYVWQKGIGKAFNEVLQKIDAMHSSLNQIKIGVQRALGALAFLATEDVKKCPSLVWMVPADCIKGHTARAWIKWAEKLSKRRYHIYFICQHSFTAVEPPIEISVGRNWVVQAAPVLKLGLMVLAMAIKSYSLPFPNSTITSFLDQLQISQQFVASFLDESTKKLLSNLEVGVRRQTIDGMESEKIRPLTCAAYEVIAEKAVKPDHAHWKESMSPVVSYQCGSPIWVKKEYTHFY